MEKIKFLGVPFAFGQPHEGVRKAPAHLRLRGVLECLEGIAPVRDLGDVDFSLLGNTSDPSSWIRNARASTLGCELISKCIEKEPLDRSFLLNVGGDHGLALGTIHGILTQRPETVVVWADAHGDINPPEASQSGNFHGMPLSFLLGLNRNEKRFAWMKRFLSPRKLILFGPRDLDAAEAEIIRELSIRYISSAEIKRQGTEALLTKALAALDPEGSSPIHLSFDVDFCDPALVSATGTPVLSGPQRKDVLDLGLCLGRTGRLRSMDVVELNPEIGTAREVNETFALVAEFLEGTLRESFANLRMIEKGMRIA